MEKIDKKPEELEKHIIEANSGFSNPKKLIND